MSATSASPAPLARRIYPMRATDAPVHRFAVLAPVGLAIVAVLGLTAFSTAGSLAVGAGIAAYTVGAIVFGAKLRRHHDHARLGLANAVTLLRLALVSSLVIPLVGLAPAPIAIIVVATISLSLDGVDGWLARRQGLSSRFGGSFDMEVDSVFALVLAALAVVVGGAPWIVLLLGLPRYLFFIAGAIWPWLYDPLPPRYSGKVVAVIQMITLIVLQLPGLPHALAIALTVGVLGALGWSFGRDIVWLWRRKA
ncbi:CDP-alcohol phosphatidyltransferase family protein [Microcella sp.]|uniref:CDP-alcohol phosphatidyltransferase family protein n=1 Tax=Microcella sp. TaxID=1913979 RepID=UPI0025658D87|nr:CDP-alcohol phosphatidyltransferase family protein [Microcella sp.]MBX9470396.1 CDP-alcohol phosphatidyltransferase family protein [Microcella sp.]